MIKFVIF